MFDDEFDYRFISNAQELTDMADSIFVGLLAAQEVNMGSGGGGSQSELPWRDKDDDDLKWARKCALFKIISNLLHCYIYKNKHHV